MKATQMKQKSHNLSPAQNKSDEVGDGVTVDVLHKSKKVSWKILQRLCNDERGSFEMLGQHLESMTMQTYGFSVGQNYQLVLNLKMHKLDEKSNLKKSGDTEFIIT